MWFYEVGYEAFIGAAVGWMLGLIPMPFLVFKLRKSRSLSLPQWLEEAYSDGRLRILTATTLVVAYSLYLVIQFRAFGTVLSHMFNVNQILATALIYLFVLYTTFGGLPSVVRSDSINIVLIVAGITIAAVALMAYHGFPTQLHDMARSSSPHLFDMPLRGKGILILAGSMATRSLGVASNPQYAIRIMSAKTRRTALSMLLISSLVIGWIYFCLTLLALGGHLFVPGFVSMPAEVAFSKLFTSLLPPFPAVFLLMAVLAAAVSTANSQLLLATCSLCYDIFRRPSKPEGFMEEERFLLFNRWVVALMASGALVMSLLPLPDILWLDRFSWTMVAICFFLPLYFPGKRRSGLFHATGSALIFHTLLSTLLAVPPEFTILPAIALEWVLWKALARREANGQNQHRVEH